MDCLHFTLRDVTTRENALEKARTAARTFFGHDAFDIEMEARPESRIDGHPFPWCVDITVRTWDLDE